jgi:hypothetical protein
MEKHYRPRKEGKAGQHGSEDMAANEAKVRAMAEELLQLKRQVREQEEMLRAKDNREAELLKQQQLQRNVGGNDANEKAKSGSLNMNDIWVDDNNDDSTVATVSQDERYGVLGDVY